MTDFSQIFLHPERLVHLHCDRCRSPFNAYAPPGTTLTAADILDAVDKHQAQMHPKTGVGGCGHCGRSYRLTGSGLLRSHNVGLLRCSGSGLAPVEAARGAARVLLAERIQDREHPIPASTDNERG